MSAITKIFDEKSFVETDIFLCGKTFVDGIEAKGEGVVTGYGTISNNACYFAYQNNAVLNGSLGRGQADKIVKCMNMAGNSIRIPVLNL